ncbi:hypothetical protein [Actinomadura fibrosa]|uniref:Uncharacterized protein n=1 Tax=Actinomadura fibrosa TaxID=111802 RepID=A0ABW2Y3U8_9ACTN|nr:hypothetical protein [Actinomadura fibrosa]
MDPDEVARRIQERLVAQGYTLEPATIAGLPSHVARKKFMHWPTLSSLHTFIAIGRAQGGNPLPYTSAVLDYAVTNKTGLPPGLQTGVLATAFLVVPTVDQASVEAVRQSSPPKRWAAMSSAVLVDASTNTYFTYQGRRVIGAAYTRIFTKTLTQTTENLLTPAR